MKTKSYEWENAGEIGVDAGLCWIGDPCYCVTPDATGHPAKTWSEFCDIVNGQRNTGDCAVQFNYKHGNPGLGVCVGTGYGDGCYPVFIKRCPEVRVAEVRVVFIGKEADAHYADGVEP